MMNIPELLAKLQHAAMHDEKLKDGFLKTRKSEFPLKAFCDYIRSLGYEIYPMEIIAAGEESYAAMKRSTNGGGENSPMVGIGDDLYEDFFASLESGQND